MFTILQQVTVI